MSKEKRDPGRSGATRARVKAPADPLPERESADARNAQLMLRLRQGLKRAIVEEAHRRRVSVQSLILTALRRDGLPVEKQDLEDLRVGRPAGARRAQAFLGLEPKSNRYGHQRQFHPSDAYDEDNDLALETLVRALGRLGIGSGSGGISINNHCGCSGGPRSTATPRVPSFSRKKGAAKKRRR